MRRPVIIGAIAGGLAPVLALVVAEACDERCHPVVLALTLIPYFAFLVFPGVFVQQRGWLTLAVIVGFWAIVGALIGGANPPRDKVDTRGG